LVSAYDGMHLGIRIPKRCRRAEDSVESTSYPIPPTGSTAAVPDVTTGIDERSQSETAGQARQTAQVAGEQAGRTMDAATGAAKDVAGTAVEQGKQVASEAAAQARDLAGQARDQLRAQSEQQARQLAGSVRRLAEELHGMASNSPQQGPASQAARQAASKGHELASYLESASSDDILDDLRRTARRYPGRFLLGAAVAGFVTARIAKGAAQAESSQPTPRSATIGRLGSESEPYPREAPIMPPVAATTTSDPALDYIGDESLRPVAGTPYREDIP
jgi:polyhydroxyalkanoate synthesis regulator phasin